jgi:hypothetical protein
MSPVCAYYWHSCLRVPRLHVKPITVLSPYFIRHSVVTHSISTFHASPQLLADKSRGIHSHLFTILNSRVSRFHNSYWPTNRGYLLYNTTNHTPKRALPRSIYDITRHISSTGLFHQDAIVSTIQRDIYYFTGPEGTRPLGNDKLTIPVQTSSNPYWLENQTPGIPSTVKARGRVLLYVSLYRGLEIALGFVYVRH